MAELKLVSPLLSNMEMERCISQQGGTSVYLMRSTKSGQTYVLKHISVPESQKQVDALLFAGAAASEADAQKYYEQVVADYQAELELLEELSSSPNLDCYRSYQIEPKDNAVGYDVYLLTELRKTLAEYLSDNAMTQLTAVNLGMDLCSALSDLREAGLVHRDVKPSNIYLSAQGHFALGDLGVAKLDELKYCSIAEHMLSSYSAPELFDLVGTIDPTADIYSVGMILYRIYNGNHGPFEDEQTTPKAADKRRTNGEPLPAPMYADYEMAAILLKACAYDPQDRFATPDELRQALVEYTKRNQLEDTLIVPPIVSDSSPIEIDENEEAIEPVQFADTEAMPEDFKESFAPDAQIPDSIIETAHVEEDDDAVGVPFQSLEQAEEDAPFDDAPVAPVKQRKSKTKRNLIILAAVAALLALLAAAYFLIYAPATIHVSAITLVERESTSITVNVDSSEKDGSFGVLCSDAYGNTSRQSFLSGQDIVFEKLVPGTEYIVSIEPLNDETVTGTSSLRVVTITETNILSFSATPVSVTQVELNLTLNGPDPGLWTVEYAAEGAEAKTVSFSGHSTIIADLLPDKLYTFTLQQPEGTHLQGVTSATYSTVPTVDIVGDLTVALSSSSALLSWDFEGDAPEHWTVTVEGADGYADTQVVTSPSVTFEGLTSGCEYTVTISAPNMLRDGVAVITPTVTELTELSVKKLEDSGDYAVSWSCKVDPAVDEWRVSYGLAGVEGFVPVSTETDSTADFIIPRKGLIPNAEYEVTLELVSGDALSGVDSVVRFTTDASQKHPLSVFPGLFVCPNVENWSIQHLAASVNSFTTSQKIAYVLEATAEIKNSTEAVEIITLVRNADGSILDLASESKVWNDLWTYKKYTGSFPNTPQTAGNYTLEVYFDGMLIATMPFSVKTA